MAQTWETRQTYDIDVILCVFSDTRRGLPIDWKPPDFFPFLLCRAKSNRVSLSSSPSSPPDPSSSEMQLSSSTSRSSNFILANVFSMLTALHVVHEGSEFVMHCMLQFETQPAGSAFDRKSLLTWQRKSADQNIDTRADLWGKWRRREGGQKERQMVTLCRRRKPQTWQKSEREDVRA